HPNVATLLATVAVSQRWRLSMRVLIDITWPGVRGLFATGALLLGATRGEAQTANAARIDPSWLRADTATKTAELSLVGGLTDLNGGMNFDGFSRGALAITVPQGWNV